MLFADQSSVAPATAISRAVTFLTQPLLLTYSHSKITALQLILQSTLTTAFLSTCRGNLTLSLSPITPPPLAIHVACMAANLPWSNWISLLGSTAFELHISLSCVSIHIPNRRSTAIWGSLPPLPSVLQPTVVNSVPASKSNLITTLRSSLKRRIESPTLAQRLLESSHEDSQADAMFPLLSKSDIYVVSATPTRTIFSPPLNQDTSYVPSATHSVHIVSFSDIGSDSDTDSEEDSRPSSRAASTSDISLSSFASSSRSSHSSISSSGSPISSPEIEEAMNVVVDNTKTKSTRYIYAGGVSTVLTGGVMLGSTLPSPAPSPVSRLGPSQNTGKDAKLSENVSAPVWRPKMRVRIPLLGPDSGNWRRVGGIGAVGARR